MVKGDDEKLDGFVVVMGYERTIDIIKVVFVSFIFESLIECMMMRALIFTYI